MKGSTTSPCSGSDLEVEASKQRWLFLTLLMVTIAAALLLPLASPIRATACGGAAKGWRYDYDFKVVNETVHVYVNPDASVTINYTITFENYGTTFDYIDIGFPNPLYDLSSVRAYWALEGQPFQQLTDIAPSSVLDVGVEIYLPPSLRPGAGERGTLICWGRNPQMVYFDTQHPGYVGYEFIPTWFDPDYCRSTDWLSVHLHFPTGFFNGTQAYWHHIEPTRHYTDSNSLVYVWEYANADPSSLLVGISFPYDESYITTAYQQNTLLDFFGVILGGILEFILDPVFVALFIVLCCACISSVKARSKGLVRTGYLPPAVKVETLGIRRGLTVVEAAVLHEIPLNRVFTMIIFGLLRKSLITLNRTPRGKPTFHPNPQAIKEAAKKGALHYYERLLLKAIKPNGTLDRNKIRTMLKTLIKTVARKLEGYNRTQTKQYYQTIIEKAWKQIETAQTPQAQAKALDQYAEWLLIDPAYETRLQQYPDYYVPSWYYWWLWTTSPTIHTTHPTPTPSQTLTTPIHLTNFANTVVTGVNNFANTVITGFQNLANQIATAFQPPPPTTRRGGYACACACACVSCACACAGGGR